MTDPDATVLANAAHKATNPSAMARRHSTARSTLAFAAAFGIGLVLASGVQHLLHPTDFSSDALAANAPARIQANNLASIAASTPNRANNPPARPAVQPSAPVVTPRLSAAIILDGQQLDNPDQLMLPSDSVFALNLRSSHSGSAEVYAINPAGQASVLWSTYLQAGQNQRTPEMRLQGQRGDETLRIVFRPDATPAGARAATVLRQISILHV